MTLTKEWLLKTIAELEEERDAIPGAVNEDAAMALAAMKLALASLGAEPVGYFYADKPGDWYQISDGDRVPDHRRIPLYSSPQSGPVVKLPNEFISNEGIVVQIEKVMAVLAVSGIRYERKGNACRAAMLQGAEPVTTAYKLPANTPCKDAPEHIWLQTAGVWPENGEFSELTWCSDNQHPDDTLYVRADVVAGNSPAIPDGWVACSERMPETAGNYWGWWNESKRQGPVWFIKSELQAQFQSSEITHWMPLPAAPQQEA